jgi:hypothetical protein
MQFARNGNGVGRTALQHRHCIVPVASQRMADAVYRNWARRKRCAERRAAAKAAEQQAAKDAAMQAADDWWNETGYTMWENRIQLRPLADATEVFVLQFEQPEAHRDTRLVVAATVVGTLDEKRWVLCASGVWAPKTGPGRTCTSKMSYTVERDRLRDAVYALVVSRVVQG